MSQLKKLIQITFICLSVWHTAANALPSSGSCEGHVFDLKDDGKKVVFYYPLYALRDNIPVYTEENSDRVSYVLPFAERATPLEISVSADSGRIKIKKYDALPDALALGWVDRHELLCTPYPLQLNNGLERKAFINTAAQQKKPLKGVPVYKSYDKDFVCEVEQCRLDPLGRFDLYYIAAEDTDNQRYLLASEADFTVGRPLVGWIDACDIIPWNTTLQVRPKDNVEAVTAIPGLIPGLDLSMHNCSVENKTSSFIAEEGITLTGGRSWYKLPYHLPVLAQENGYYQLAAPGRGLANFEYIEKRSNATDDLQSRFEHIDVFFLIDGTSGMQTYIDELQRLIPRLETELKKSPDSAAIKPRFGFRIYRDSYAGSRGLGETLPLSSGCQSLEHNTATHFQQQLSAVSDSGADPREKGDSYPEALFAGMQQALDDMESCPDHLKLLFVIGDHGDNAVNPPASLLKSLNETFDLFTLFFVQTPGTGKEAGFASADACFNASPIVDFSANNPAHAYERFQRQACDMLESVAHHNGMNARDYFNLNALSDTNLKHLDRFIQSNIEQFSNVSTVEEVIARLRGGQSVQSLIEAGLQEGDVPAIYWRHLKKDACQKMPELCDQPSSQNVFFMYAPVSDKWEEEMWISDAQLDEWFNLLRPLSKISKTKSPTEQKNEFIETLKHKIQTLFGMTISDSNEAEKTLYQLLEKRKVVLPMRKDSPLLQYTFSEIRDMEGCEFVRLIKWTANILDVLEKVSGNPSLKLVLAHNDYDHDMCPVISQKGRNIKRLAIEKVAPLNHEDDRYSYRQDFRGKPIYIIPTGFLP